MSNKSILLKLHDTLKFLPQPLRSRLLSAGYGSAVRFYATAGIRIQFASRHKLVMSLRNKRKVRNHIGSVHAAAMGLLAESTSGAITALNLPANKLPLCKTMHIDFVKMAHGDLTATATLTDKQINMMQTLPKGEIAIPVILTDANNIKPVVAEFVWAWIPNKTAAKKVEA